MSNLSGSDYLMQRVTASACHLVGITHVKSRYAFQLLFNRHLSGCIYRSKQSAMMLNSSFMLIQKRLSVIFCLCIISIEVKSVLGHSAVSDFLSDFIPLAVYLQEYVASWTLTA